MRGVLIDERLLPVSPNGDFHPRSQLLIKSITSVYQLVFKEFRPEFFGIAVAGLAIGILEMLGVASIMPLIAAMIDPDAFARSPAVASFLRVLGLSGTLPPIHVTAGITIGLFVVVNIASLALSYWSLRFSARLALALSERYALAIFGRPFTYFLANSPAELAQRTCHEVGQFASSGIIQLCFALVRAIQLALIVVALMAISPQVTIAFFVILAGIYVLIYRYSAARMVAAGAQSTDAASRAVHLANEMYAVSREVLLTGRSVYFVDRLGETLRQHYRADGIARFLPSVPKYALEVLSVGLIFALPIYRSLMGEDARAELPLIATFAYAGFRLLPVAQQLYSCLTILQYHAPTAARLHGLVMAPATASRRPDELERMPGELRLDGVGYHYASAERGALMDATFTIARGERIAIVGPSGSGKSTLIDLLLGLLTPTSGSFVISGGDTGGGQSRKTTLTWRHGAIGYVPQQPLLLSDTLAANIAFGEDKRAIDHARCRDAARKAGIAHVLDQSTKGLDAIVGRDIQDLSGGERQRLAIARGLYARPSLLVLDEPASALDPPTARRMFEQLCARDLDATVVIITHSVEHLALFDKVVFVEAGRVAAIGSLDKILKDSPAFAAFRGGHGNIA